MATKKTHAPPPPRKPRTRDELRVMSRHLGATWRDFVHSLRLGNVLPEHDDIVENALFVHNALTFRRLLDFYDPPRAREADVVAADYIPNWEPMRAAVSEPEARKEVKTVVNKLVAHLTEDMVAHPDFIPPNRAHMFALWLQQYHRRFIENVDPDYLDPELWNDNMTYYAIVRMDETRIDPPTKGRSYQLLVRIQAWVYYAGQRRGVAPPDFFGFKKALGEGAAGRVIQVKA